jgi:hypothetical protein
MLTCLGQQNRPVSGVSSRRQLAEAIYRQQSAGTFGRGAGANAARANPNQKSVYSSFDCW